MVEHPASTGGARLIALVASEMEDVLNFLNGHTKLLAWPVAAEAKLLFR